MIKQTANMVLQYMLYVKCMFCAGIVVQSLQSNNITLCNNNKFAQQLNCGKIIHSSYELLSHKMDSSLTLAIIAILIAFFGVIIAGLNLYINELNRRMNSFRLAFDLKNFREEKERQQELDKLYREFVIS